MNKQILFYVLSSFFSPLGPLPVQNVMATHINNTAIRVSWSPLTLTQARGFLTGYTITLAPTPISRKRQNNGIVIAMAGPTDTSIVVTGLNPTVQYSVTVVGGTSARIGEPGPAVTPQLPSPEPGNICAHTLRNFSIVSALFFEPVLSCLESRNVEVL